MLEAYSISRVPAKSTTTHILLAEEQVVLKTLKQDYLTKRSKKAFAFERLITKHLVKHPHVVHFINHFEAGKPYLVLAHYPRGSLDAHITPAKPLHLDLCYSIIQGLALGLEHIHKTGIIHRDIKPSNTLLDGNFTPAIADFGIATLQGQDTHPLSGAAHYLAPELQAGAKPSEVTDVYALGVKSSRLIPKLRH